MSELARFIATAVACTAILFPWVWLTICMVSNGRPYVSRLRAYLRWRRRHG